MYLINATSLAKPHALQMLASDFRQFNAYVGCVTETWFNENMTSNCVHVDGFSLYRKDRKKRKGGGVCIYVKDFLPSCIYYSSNDFEVIWVKVSFHGNCFFIAACYHPLTPSIIL